MQYQTTTNWLKCATAFVIGFGVLCLVGTVPAISGPARFMLDRAYWPVNGMPGELTPQARLLWAISGGMLAGWGVLLWQVITHIYAHNPALGRSMILASIGTWFVLDSTGSIAAGAPMNALFNVGFLALYAVPLWRPVREASGPA
ncbi:MAG: hypothetical protein GY789_23575 [Hyphomicrobiales bacterium]|nr:hypothetical protein [Hyphomicrobiales bacterium]